MTDKNPALDPDGTLPKVPGWIGLTEAAERLGYTRQHAFRLAQGPDRRFKTLARLGSAHTMCVKVEEVEHMLAARNAERLRAETRGGHFME